MIFHDISKDLRLEKPFEDDPETKLKRIKNIESGDMYNLSAISCCVHSATHIDAPLHYLRTGKSIAEMDLSYFYGECSVISIEGTLTGEHMEKILPYAKKRLLIHGNSNGYIGQSAVSVMADHGIVLIGTDAPSIAPDFDCDQTHYQLLRSGIAILENVDLSAVKDGNYVLSAFPVKISMSDGAPCRAVLIEGEKMFWFS